MDSCSLSFLSLYSLLPLLSSVLVSTVSSSDLHDEEPLIRQDSCGSCGSFSTTGEVATLSEQQLVDCDQECNPKEGGACDSGSGT
ncbi:hypothetical protein ACOSQ4_011147 [Xanthoceras sorbifolium]